MTIYDAFYFYGTLTVLGFCIGLTYVALFRWPKW